MHSSKNECYSIMSICLYVFNPGLPMMRVDTMAMVLNFFAEVCAEGHMRDWLGSAEGSVFWPPLLSLLCNKSSSADNGDFERPSR
jgi:hypothetical protein